MKTLFTILLLSILSIATMAYSAEVYQKKDASTLSVTAEVKFDKSYEQIKAELVAAQLERFETEVKFDKILAGIDETIVTLQKRLTEADNFGIKNPVSDVE